MPNFVLHQQKWQQHQHASVISMPLIKAANSQQKQHCYKLQTITHTANFGSIMSAFLVAILLQDICVIVIITTC